MGGLLHWYSSKGTERPRPRPRPVPSSLYQCNSPPITASVQASYYSMWHYNCLWILMGNLHSAEQQTIRQYSDWYNGRSPLRPLLSVLNVSLTAHSLTASVPISYYSMRHYNYLCTLNGWYRFSSGVKKGKGAYSSSWNSPQNYGTPLVNGITQCYLPPDRGDRPAFTPTGQVGCVLLQRSDRFSEWSKHLWRSKSLRMIRNKKLGQPTVLCI